MRLILFLVLTISCEIDKPKCDNACMVNRLEILNKRVKELENHIYVQYSENTQKNLN
jgi:galactokinase/mevalonate kinase-like predicted kinase